MDMKRSSSPAPTAARRTRWWVSLRRAVSWHRRKLGVLAAVIAVVATVTALSPAPPPTTDVVVAAVPLSPGHRLSAGDLTVAAVPDALVPEAAVTDPAQVVGRTLTGALTRGQMLTEPAVVRPGPEPRGDGLVTTPLRLSDPEVVDLLRVGDEIDVLAADPRSGTSTVVAERARIAAIPEVVSSGPLSGGSGTQLVLVEVSPKVAAALAAAAVNGPLSVVWH